jgi:hypothetical protein
MATCALGTSCYADWRVALAFGFVFDVDDFVAALRRP